MRVLVCGGRDFADYAAVDRALTAVNAEGAITALIEGGATGADNAGKVWASVRNIPVETYRADWKRHGRAAGPLRNTVMLDKGRPDAVVAFPGGKGTADMIRQATRAGIKVIDASTQRKEVVG